MEITKLEKKAAVSMQMVPQMEIAARAEVRRYLEMEDQPQGGQVLPEIAAKSIRYRFSFL